MYFFSYKHLFTVIYGNRKFQFKTRIIDGLLKLKMY